MGAVVLLLIIVLVIWLIARRGRRQEPAAPSTEERLATLEREVARLRRRIEGRPEQEEAWPYWPEPAARPETAVPAQPAPTPARPPSPSPAQPAPVAAALRTAPVSPELSRALERASPRLEGTREPLPPDYRSLSRTPAGDAAPRPVIDWESFMGVKLFAWLGGFALFLGAAFFVKYSIEHELISPLMRVVISFLVGAGVIAGGLLLRPRGYAVTVQALCAAGVTVLYADIFAARSFYQFISTPVAFVLMSLVTVTAFLLALRLDARYVSILGAIGGYLTPYLLSTGEDHPVGLFGYLLLLDAGLLAVALKKRWDFLAPMAAAGTLAIEIDWTAKFFAPEKALTGAVVWGLFAFLFLAAAHASGRVKARTPLFDGAAVMPALAAMAFSGVMVGLYHLGARPGLTLGFLTLLLAGVSALSLLDEGFEATQAAAAGLAFAVLLQWTLTALTPALLPWGLAFTLAFAALTSAFPLLLPRLRTGAAPPPWSGYLPLLSLLLFVVPVTRHLTGLSLWMFLLLADAAVLAAAWLTGAAGAALLAVVLSFLPMAFWLGAPRASVAVPHLLGVVGLFAVALFAATLLRLRREERGGAARPAPAALGDIGPELRGLAEPPAVAAVLPFLLLIGVVAQLRPASLSPVFGLAVLLTALLLALVRLRAADALGLSALLAAGLLALAAVLGGYDRLVPGELLGWPLLFVGVHMAFPFVFLRALAGRVLPWATAALAGPVLFWPLYRAAVELFGKDLIGALPAALALPCLAGLAALVRRAPGDAPATLAQKAWLGGAALFFVTLIFPLQFSKEWITIGWALEGAALVWLFRRVPHRGLIAWGAGLLAVAFVRLALNPAVVTYHQRAASPLLNWYLLAYGVTALSFFAAAHLLPAEEDRALERIGARGSLRGLLRAAGTVLLFLLVNIEIADYFSTGPTLTFRFSGSFAMDVAYSLAWGAFALALLLAGIRSGNKAARLASLGLFVATIAKVFLHDLWRLGQLYRVGSIVVLAVLLILVSFLYQRFVSSARGGGRRDGGQDPAAEEPAERP